MTIVVTTINCPQLLQGYAENFSRHGHLDAVDVIVVGDRKTPHHEARALATSLSEAGLQTEYMDIEAQGEYMRRFPALDEVIPFDSDVRRNIGYLKAYESEVGIIVALDDDNFVGAGDWFAAHSIVGSTAALDTVSSSSGWFNVCSLMDTEPEGRTVYPRGHPYGRRHAREKLAYARSEGRVVLNGGLWLGDPDVDSLSRLTEVVRCTRLNAERIMLAPGTWAPINSQNTAVHRDVMPAFFYVPVNARIGGIAVDRFGDIWAGLFARKVIDHLDDRVIYGIPACDHRRNPHVLLNDLALEFWGVMLTEHLWEKIHSWDLRSTTYSDAYLELADLLEAEVWTGVPMPQEIGAYFGRMAGAMRAWIRAIRTAAG